MPVVGAVGGGFGNHQSPIHNLVISSFIIGTFAGYVVSLVLSNTHLFSNKTTTDTTTTTPNDDDDDIPSRKTSCDNTDGRNDDNNVDAKDNSGGIDESNRDEENFDHDDLPGMMILEGVEDKTITPPVNKKSIRMVIQRCRTAKLELDTDKVVTIGNITDMNKPSTTDDDDNNKNDPSSSDEKTSSSSIGGLIVYISFAKGTTEQTVNDAAKTLLQLPLLTHGKWGDGSKTHSILQIAAQQPDVGVGGGIAIMIVPQANLTSHVKRYGKSIQYHDQIDRATGCHYYRTFLFRLEVLALEQQCRRRGTPPPPSLQKEVIDGEASSSSKNKPHRWDASVDPVMMFHDESLYASWDDSGFPLTDVQGKPTTTSARKKMKKMYETQKKRHETFLSKGETTAATTTTVDETVGSESRPSDWPLLDERFLRIVSGTFGNRQGLEFKSDMGPFCHVIDF